MIDKLIRCGSAISLSLLTACAATPTPQFYLLAAQSQAASKIAKNASKRIIGLGPISIPSVLERKQIVTRGENNSVQITELHQWAAPLKDSITETISQNLSRILPSDIVRVYPWHAYGDTQYRTVIDIIRFDTNLRKTAHFEANWAIVDNNTHSVLSNGHSQLEKKLLNSSYPAAIDALSGLLDDFSQELALVLNKFPTHK